MSLSSVIFGILAVSFMYIVIYKWYFVSIFVYYKDPAKESNPQKNTIFLIISVKNEANRLPTLLKSIFTSDFLESDSKVIVIDDHSTPEQISRMMVACEGLEQVEFLVSQATKGKKHAIRYAIEKFPNQYYAFTDADCVLGVDWYRSILKGFEHADFIMGYAPFSKKAGLLNSMQRYEGLWVATQYMGYALRRDPYMAVGRNMAVSGRVLGETIPKMKADHLLSGDDDMLVQALARSTSIAIMLEEGSFAMSNAEETYSSYLSQRTRQISTSYHYKTRHKLLLGGISAAMMLFYPLALFSVFHDPLMGLGSLLLMGFINVLFFWVPTQKFSEHDLRWKVLYLEIIYTINLYVLGISSLVGNSGKWK